MQHLKSHRIFWLVSGWLALAITGLTGCSTAPTEEDTVANTQTTEPSQHLPASTTNEAMSGRQKVEYELALNLLEKANYKDAGETLTSIVRSKTCPAEVKANYALAMYKQERLEDAEKAITTAIEQQNAVADYHNLAGLIALDSGKYQKAEASFKQALTLNSEHPFAHYNIALLYDIYYQEIELAYKHYLKYLNLVNYKDKETVQWVEQLSYSVENN